MFNDYQKAHILNVFHSVDELLAKMLDYLDSSGPGSPFSDFVTDATPIQGRVIADYSSRVRNAMRRLLESHAISLPAKRTSAVWAARAAIMAARVSVDEMRPRAVRGYGTLTDDDAQELEKMIAQLQDLLNQMDRFLATGPGHELQSRLERLEGNDDFQRMLKRLDRTITKHGLIEFRASLEMLVERLESNSYEVAIFGRVSSGKSSLLDHLLETDVLPVGVTPVTAIPIRIAYGEPPRATITFAEFGQKIVALSQLPDFATEQHNPSNAKHVSRIQLDLPSAILRAGVAFIDTPGLGSLALKGGLESLWYLPRCDLGIVLVDASSTLAADDVSLVHSLYAAGAEAMVLLSKADLLSEQERRQAADYTRRQLYSEVGREAPVYVVSVKGDSAKLCDTWRREKLVPCLDGHRERFHDSMRRKITVLREAVVTALKQRCRSTIPRAETVIDNHDLEQSLATVLAQLDRARYAPLESFRGAGMLVHEVLKDAAEQIASGWSDQAARSQDVTEIIRSAANRAAQRVAAVAATGVHELSQTATNVLQQCADKSAKPDSGLADSYSIAGLPLLDISPQDMHAVVIRPLLGLLGKTKMAHGIEKQLESQVFQNLTRAFDRYQGKLLEWRRHTIDEMHRMFTARADLLRAQRTPASAETRITNRKPFDVGHDTDQPIRLADAT